MAPHNLVELDVLMPLDLLRLCDDAERGDTYACQAIGAVHMTRSEIKQGGVGCIACGRTIVDTVAIVYCVAVMDASHALRAVICASCAEAHPKRDLCLIASESLAHHIYQDHARSRGGVVHEAGHV
jgi:hypothetical protein